MSGFRDSSELNDRLVQVLNREQQERARTHFSAALLESRFLESIELSHDGVDLIALDRKTRLRLALKTMTELTTTHAARGIDGRQIPTELVQILGSFHDHNLGIYSGPINSRRVLIEWRMYAGQEVDETVLQELFVRLECIVDLLRMEKPRDFCSLPCRGFFHDASRRGFGVIYDLSLKLSDDCGPGIVTLKDLIKSNEGIAKQPILDDKFRLAWVLANALLEFHLVGWLHKGLASSNIIFTHQSPPQLDIIRDPYIIGFNHSRPDEPSAFTTGPSGLRNYDYQHPRYQQSKRGYKREYDYYSLGIILLEIGFWETLGRWKRDWTEKLGRTENRKRSISPEEVYEKLLKARVPYLGQVMGSTYRDAVLACLTGSFTTMSKAAEDASGREAAVQLGFGEQVVERLGGLLRSS